MQYFGRTLPLLSLLTALALPGCLSPGASGPDGADDKADGAGSHFTLHRTTDWYPTELEVECPFDGGCDVLLTLCVSDFDSGLEETPTFDDIGSFGTLGLTAPDGTTSTLYGEIPAEESGLCPTLFMRSFFAREGRYGASLSADDFDRAVAERLDLSRVSLDLRFDLFPHGSLRCTDGDTGYCEATCGDGLDGDGDGASDCDDLDCAGMEGCPPPPPPPATVSLPLCDEESSCEVQVTGHVSAGDAHEYTVEVRDAEALLLTLTPTDGGDPDLYVEGPNGEFCSSLRLSGQVDECEIESPSSGTYTVRVKGWSDSDFTLTASAAVTARVLESEWSGTDLARDHRHIYEVPVGEGATSLEISLVQTEGDATLYASHGSVPDGALGFRCAKVLPRGGDKACSPIEAPEAGTWYVVVEGAADSPSAYTVHATVHY